MPEWFQREARERKKIGRGEMEKKRYFPLFVNGSGKGKEYSPMATKRKPMTFPLSP